MAQPGGTSARAQRLIGLAATLLLAVTTALAFSRVFVGTRATLVLLATAIASAAIAVALERRGLALATTASAAGAALAVGLTVFRDTTWYGLPTSETLAAALDAAGVVGEQARIQVAPAEPIAPLLLAAVVSLWAALFSAHALAFRAGSPLLGLVPPVALVAFADSVLERSQRPMYGLAFLAAALLVVFADGLSRVQGWGPVWSSSRSGVAAIAGRGARRLAFAALAAGLIAPIVVPGFGSRAVIDLGTSPEDGIAIDPFVSVQSQLKRERPVDILSVSSPRPTYLRLLALPTFDGSGWRHDPDRTGSPVPSDGAIGGPALLGPTDLVTIDVLSDLNMPWLPAPYPAEAIRADREVSYDLETGTAVTQPLDAGASYEVDAAFVTATADDLRVIPDQPGFGSPAPAGDPYLALPPGLPEEIRAKALEWTSGRTTVFDRALAIQERLRRFRYNPDATFGSGPEAILTFLNETREGFCQQFAASMAVMLRTLGIPSRVVVGFTSGPAVNGRWVVTSDRAHAWVEVRFPGVGWMPFEPTPNRQNPTVIAYTQAAGGPGGGGPDAGAGGAAADPARPNRIEIRERATGFRGENPGATGGFEAPSPASGVSSRIWLLLALALAGVALLLVPPLRALRWRLRMRRAAAEPRRLILLTFERFTDLASGVGLGRGPGETFDEYRRRVLESGHLSDGHLDRLTAIATSAAYSPRAPDARDAGRATEAAGTALTEIRRAVGPARWVSGLYRRS
jgi:transglutaminase-like putative cysteine protease